MTTSQLDVLVQLIPGHSNAERVDGVHRVQVLVAQGDAFGDIRAVGSKHQPLDGDGQPVVPGHPNDPVVRDSRLRVQRSLGAKILDDRRPRNDLDREARQRVPYRRSSGMQRKTMTSGFR